MNFSDSEIVASILSKNGYKTSDDLYTADLILVNTCSIREKAELTVRKRLEKFNKVRKTNLNVKVGVLGCMAQSLKHDLLEKRSFVDIILGPDSYRRLPDLLKRSEGHPQSLVDTKLSRFEVYDDLFPSRNEGINAWISIMRGCDKFCTFCIVPFTRGRERSRNTLSILEEAKQAVKQGYKEITLLGQNVNSYHYEDHQFNHLLEAVAGVPGIQRIRYTSPHPQDITEELLSTMSKHKNICNYIHLPLQAGSDKILKRMHRTYSKSHFLSLVQRIRDILPDVGISTDIIVGFPGETDEDFGQTIEVMNEVKFDSAFNFKYSSRRGTKASEYEDKVQEEIKQQRLEQVIDLQKKHTLERNMDLVGTLQAVLVEKESKMSSDYWAGRTDSNKWVIFKKENIPKKDMVSVLIKEAKGITLHGEFIQSLEKAA